MLLRLASMMNFTFHLPFRRWEANQSVRLMRLREGLYLSHEDLLGHASGGTAMLILGSGTPCAQAMGCLYPRS